MPVYIGIVLKILSDFVLILIEYCFPKIIYIHIGQMFLHKFRFVEPSISHPPRKEHPYMSELALFPAYAAIAPECAI